MGKIWLHLPHARDFSGFKDAKKNYMRTPPKNCIIYKSYKLENMHSTKILCSPAKNVNGPHILAVRSLSWEKRSRGVKLYIFWACKKRSYEQF